MAVWRASNLKISAPNGHKYLERALKAVKALSGLILKPIFDLCFFKKANVTTRYRKKVVRKSRYVSLRQF